MIQWDKKNYVGVQLEFETHATTMAITSISWDTTSRKEIRSLRAVNGDEYFAGGELMGG